MIKTAKFFAVFAILVSAIFAQRQSDFPITGFPTWVINPEDTVWIRWFDVDRDLSNSEIRFGRNPSGSDIAGYPNTISRIIRRQEPTAANPIRGFAFIPAQNPNLRPGINYLVIHDPNKRQTSNEVMFILKHTEQNTNMRPVGVVDNSTPQFSWTKAAGVPYSHIVLSDEEIEVGGDGTLSLESIQGVSMIWQAITPNTRITYGEPDPSGIFASTPPPLSPGRTYTWLVFNNYGNNPAYTPSNDMVLPAAFTIRGVPRRQPVNVSPIPRGNDTLVIRHTDNNGNITFRWTNLDPLVSVYRVFLYSEIQTGGVDAQVVVWSGEVTAGQFAGKDTASLTMSARNILSENTYLWRVIAIYGDGSGQSGEASAFKYSAPTGTIKVRTYEEILAQNGDVFRQRLALAQIDLEVISGSLEETSLFITDENGEATRDRAIGTSRLTARKRGYESVSQIITVHQNRTTEV